MFYLGERSKKRMAGIDADLIMVAEKAIKITLVDFGIPEHGGLRDAVEQRKLFIKGASKADGVTRKSWHQSGDALDFYAIDQETGKASWDPALMAQVACAFYQAASELGVKIKWGGLFKTFVDMPHVQIVRG